MLMHCGGVRLLPSAGDKTMGEEINEFEKVSYKRRRREGEYIVIEGQEVGRYRHGGERGGGDSGGAGRGEDN